VQRLFGKQMQKAQHYNSKSSGARQCLQLALD
jgi:hypothetical protein